MKSVTRILAFLLITLQAGAATYYVSPSGNNSNNGLSAGTAWLTLQHASNTVAAGDSVIVMPGNYTGFYHTTSGTSSQRIVFFAQPGVLINAPNATTPDGINLEGASYVVIDGFHVYGMPRTGIRSVLNDHVIIRNNRADSCFKWGILTGFSDDIIIENNECSRSVDEHGIYFSNSADNPVIRNNHSWGNNSCGIHMNGDISLGGDGIISNALVENNILHDNGVAGGSAINCDGVQNSRIQNNLAWNNHASGISLYMIDAGGGSSGNVVVNNTILQPSNGRWALNISNGSINNLAFNNILYSTHAFRGSISIDAASMSGFHSNYNVVTNRMSNDGGSTVMTLAAWQTATQNDSNSVISTPTALFVNPAVNNYHLLFSSPAIDLGIASYYSVLAPAVDIEAATRPLGGYHDAGCYESPVPGDVTENTIPFLSWNKISPDEKIVVYDLSGRIIYSGIMRELPGDVLPLKVYLIRTLGRQRTLKTFFIR
jgi:parallel beta-helix repeat protein